MIKKEKRMDIFKNAIIKVLKQNKGIAHVSAFYKALEGFEAFYKSRKSFEGTIRFLLQSYSKEFKAFNGLDVFSSLDKDGYWTFSQNRYIKDMYKQIKQHLGKSRSALICRECINN